MLIQMLMFTQILKETVFPFSPTKLGKYLKTLISSRGFKFMNRSGRFQGRLRFLRKMAWQFARLGPWFLFVSFSSPTTQLMNLIIIIHLSRLFFQDAHSFFSFAWWLVSRAKLLKQLMKYTMSGNNTQSIQRRLWMLLTLKLCLISRHLQVISLNV